MVTIISIFDKHEDFIELQYNSIRKHIKDNFEYIIFNNASTNEQALLNEEVCKKLNITNIRIHTNYYQDPSNIAGDALNETIKHLSGKKIFKIDSDMFFISDINISELFNNYELIYVPNYIDNNEIMWSGIFGIDLNKINQTIDFRPGVIQNTDTFGQSMILLQNNELEKKRLNLYNLFKIENDEYNTNINTDCVVKFKNNQLTFVENSKYEINMD